MLFALVFTALLGGIIQSMVGFGAGIFIILALSNYFNVLEAAAINTTICFGIAVKLVWKYRKWLNIKAVIVPTTMYVLFGIMAISVARNLDVAYLKVGLGLFLLVLSIYFVFFEKTVHLRSTPTTAIICGAVSGFCAGIFGIGGPLLGLYMITVTEDHNEYLANTQICFALANTATTVTRMVSGIYTKEMLSITFWGLIAVVIGTEVGTRLLKRLERERIKSAVYIFVGISGIMTMLQSI